ncbi:MAG: PAS domain S-box protein [Campylobacterota bacterium]|nr:PAS domain S-box protein [Campylobacterota bacterium]
MHIKLVLQYTKELNLLYVEDDKVLANSTKEMFAKLFKSVDIAFDGKEGLDKYNQYHKKNSYFYDLVITDINMPNIDGVAMSREILKLNPFQSIIIVSAHNESHYLHSAIDLGVSAFISKPVNNEKLKNTLYKTAQAIYDHKLVEVHLEQVESLNYTLEKQNRELLSNNEELQKLLRLLNTMTHKEHLIKPNRKTTQKKDTTEQILHLIHDDLTDLQDILEDIDHIILDVIKSKKVLSSDDIFYMSEQFSKYASTLSIYPFFDELSTAMFGFATTLKENSYPKESAQVQNIFMLLESFVYVLGGWHKDLLSEDDSKLNTFDASIISDIKTITMMWTHTELDDNVENVDDIFDELADYADYHFKSEEKVWAENFKDDEWGLTHIETHSSFIEDVIKLKDNKENKSLDDVVYDVVSFLSKWLAYHILDTDKRMAIATLQLRAGANLLDAKQYANDEMNGRMKLIVETVLTMYDTISGRTLELMREKSLRLKAEAALKVSDECWNFVLHSGAEKIWDWDINNNRINKSKGDISIFEITGNNIENYRDEIVIHPSDIEKVEKDFQAYIEGKTDFFINEHRVLRENGSWSWVLSRGKIVERDEDGKAIRMIGTHSDITQRELASLIFENSSQAIMISDSNNEIISVNPAFTKITGYKEREVIGRDPKVLSSGTHNRAFYTEMWKSLDDDAHWSGKVYNRRKSGEIYPELLEINTIKGVDDSVDHYFALFSDFTREERYKKEHEKQKESLFQQSRMAQMGEMISMIAHQWRQPLSAIATTTSSMKFSIELEDYDLYTKEGQENQNSYFLDKLTNIEDYVQGLTATINDFRNFYNPNKEYSTTTINTPVEKALYIIRASLESSGIKIEERYESDKIVTIHENEIIQVILNILKNAQDNFNEKKVKQPKIIINTKNSETLTSIEIYDNGGGVPADIFPKIFDPYFSTKNEKNGTGLGLYMSKMIVENHHKGRFYALNRDDGVSFTIEIKE